MARRAGGVDSGTISELLDKYVWTRDEGMCIYCGGIGQQIDHVLPHSRGGPTIKANLVLACKSCNNGKSNRVLLNAMTRGFYYLLTKGEDLSWTEQNNATNAVSISSRQEVGKSSARVTVGGNTGKKSIQESSKKIDKTPSTYQETVALVREAMQVKCEVCQTMFFPSGRNRKDCSYDCRVVRADAITNVLRQKYRRARI